MFMWLYHRAGLRYFCIPFKGDREERRQGLLEPFLLSESYNSKGTKFVSSLNYKVFNSRKAKALMCLFPCIATQNTEKSNPDSLTTYAHTCMCGFCAICICVL